jgi:hypothetical protein
MAALEASVSAAKSAREAGAERPVSVAEAREKKAARTKAAPKKAAASEEKAKPARKRKTA